LFSIATALHTTKPQRKTKTKPLREILPERRLEGVRGLFLPPSSPPPERRLIGVRGLSLPPSLPPPERRLEGRRKS